MLILFTATAIAILLLCLAGNLMMNKTRLAANKDSALAIVLLPYSLFSVLLMTFLLIK